MRLLCKTWIFTVFVGYVCVGPTSNLLSDQPPAKLVRVLDAVPVISSSGSRTRTETTAPTGSLLVVLGEKHLPTPLEFVRGISPGTHIEGWVASDKVIRVSTNVAAMHAVHAQERLGAAVPAIISYQPPELQRAWHDIEIAIKENSQLAMPLAEPYFARAEILMIVKDFDSALRDYLTAVHIAGQSRENLVAYKAYFERLREALESYDRMPRPPASGKASAHYAEGFRAFRSGELEAAQINFSNAVALEPDQPLFWYFRALTYLRQGNETRAKHDALIGSHLEWRDGERDQLGWGLTHVQGNLRQWLETYRLGDPLHLVLR